MSASPTIPSAPAPSFDAQPHSQQSLRALTLATLGVVFGDIGTSPLYALRQCFTADIGVPLTQSNILGVLSLIFWSLICVISIKYVLLMLRVDNRGEGGVLALSTLVAHETRNWRLWSPVAAIGLIGAALFFGDGLLTPAVSVLSAVEGLGVLRAGLDRYVVPITVVILIVLFSVQKHGTGAVGRVFGPIIILWFVTLATLGMIEVARHPEILPALNPVHAIGFFIDNRWQGFLTLSAVFLVVTGGEALYADIGHFGRIPIRNAWFGLVLPSLMLNYLGQGALLIRSPEAIQNPFYLLAPGWLLVPMILLATAATIIASQAVISGVFSVASQALALGYLPRLRILQSSAHSIGQIYVPSANWVLFAGTVLLVTLFGSSESLAAAYGIAVSATMLLAGCLLVMLAYVRRRRHRSVLLALLIAIVAMDAAFFLSNSMRILEGGWIPITIAVLLYVLMTTWMQGRRALNWKISRAQTPTAEFLKEVAQLPTYRAPGTAVYLTSEASFIPRPLSQQLRFQRTLHERTIILTFARVEIPRVDRDERVQVAQIAKGIYRIVAHHGFMERPSAVAALRLADEQGLAFDANTTLYVVGRETPVVTEQGISSWRKSLFALLARNSLPAFRYFEVPTHRLLEIGSQTEL